MTKFGLVCVVNNFIRNIIKPPTRIFKQRVGIYINLRLVMLRLTVLKYFQQL